MANEQTIANQAAQTIADELGKMGARPDRIIRNPFSALVEKLVRPVAVGNLPKEVKERRHSVRFALVSMPQYKYEWTSFSTLLDHAGLRRGHWTRVGGSFSNRTGCFTRIKRRSPTHFRM